MTIRNQATALVTAALALSVILFAGITYAQVVTTLDEGQSGDSVLALQNFLAADTSVYPEGLVTGYYGPLTTAAVQRFQCKYNIVCSGDSASTGFGRVGPLTLARIQGLGSLSVQVPAVPNTGALDVSAPIMTAATVSVTPTTVTITWQTNESAEHAVIYGNSWPFYLGTTPSVWSNTFSTKATVTLTGLQPNHTYFYARQSVDSTGNVQYDLAHSFTTASR